LTRQHLLAIGIATLAVAWAQCACALDGVAAEAGLPAPMTGSFYSAVVLEPDTGDLLVAERPHDSREPASMVKMMTELILLEAAGRGEISLSDTVNISGRASRVGGSQVYLKQGEVFTIEQLLMALAIHSANDAATALAEHHAGTTEAFVDLMNARARELGMNDTQFHSVHGLPPGKGQLPDVSSAYDMALLASELVKHPEALRWGSTPTAPFRDGEFTLHNPNHLIGKFRGLDGLKTGYHRGAGYCLTATAVQKDRRLIAVVMGAPTDRQRASEASRLLTFGFNLYSRQTLLDPKREQLSPLKVKDGKAREVPLAYAESMTLSLRKDQVGAVTIEKHLADAVTAPVEVGQVVGKAVAMLSGKEVAEVPIVATERVAEGSFLDKLLH
jgi:D-alanyl-D-alanine carboxypeptidase (penicillin-binding protein 5/6)